MDLKRNKRHITKKASRILKPGSIIRFIPLYIMMLPGLLYIFINNYLPLPGIILAFKRYNVQQGIFGSPSVGFKNFEFLFQGGSAWTITRNTILYNIAFLTIGPIIGITIAILLYELRNKIGKQIYQTIILVPYLVSIVIVSFIVYAMLNTEIGFINNSILKPLGINPVSFYSNPKPWPFILVFVNTWKSFGFTSIIYYATIVGIDPGYYEAASIDGATRWKKIWNVTLPALKSTIITLTLLGIGRIFYSDFGLFYQVPLNSGALIDVTNTIDTFVFRGLSNVGNLGMTAAAGVYQSVVGFILVVTANLIVRRISKEEALF